MAPESDKESERIAELERALSAAVADAAALRARVTELEAELAGAGGDMAPPKKSLFDVLKAAKAAKAAREASAVAEQAAG